MNADEYAMLRECGADFVTVFQETYDLERYGEMHVAGAKRCFPYRVCAQERALMGGMRGVGFGVLLGLADFRKDMFAAGIHAALLQKKYPQGEIALSFPRLRPYKNHEETNPNDVHETQLLQMMLACRIFLPFASFYHFHTGACRIPGSRSAAGGNQDLCRRQRRYRRSQ